MLNASGHHARIPMPDMTASIPHQLTRAEVKRRIQVQIGALRHRYGSMVTNLRETWTGDAMSFSLTALGQSISGHLAVDDHAVHLTVALPWLLSMLAKGIKPRIEQEARHLLARQTDAAPA